jgi:zinc protease
MKQKSFSRPPRAYSSTPANKRPRRQGTAAIVWAAAWGLLALLPAPAVAATPAIERWQTDNGAEVLFARAPALPMFDLRIVFAAGSARDGDSPGLASLTADMLTEGAGSLDADAIAERVEALGVELGTGAQRDMAWASIRSLTEPRARETAVDTLAMILAEPSFAPAAFERVRENRLIGLRLAEQDPGTVGRKAFYRAVFGNHPYAGDPGGTAEGVAALTPADLRRFHRQWYTAANATVAIVGDLEREDAARIAARATAGLPAGTAPPPLPPVPELSQGSLTEIPFPSSQTHLFMGQPGMRRDDPDYVPLYVGNHILGGSGLVSLLMEEVREKRGLSYSAYSYFVPMARRGPFTLGLQTRNDRRDQARTVMLSTLRRFIEEGPDGRALTAAIRNITGGFPLRIASNAKVVQYLALIGFYDLPLDYLERFPEQVSAVTAAQIRDAFARRIHPERLTVVMVGAGPDGAPETEAGAPTAARPNDGDRG